MFSEERLNRIVKCCWLRDACGAVLLMGSIVGLLVALSVMTQGL